MVNQETLVLIHGAMHGAWCFFQLQVELEKKGHKVITIDLPGLGIDRANPVDVHLADHVSAVVSVLDTLAGPAIVLGHSYGGIVLSQVCEERPAKIKEAVWLSAYMLKSGQSLFDIAGIDTESAVTGNIIMNAMPPTDGMAMVNSAVWREAYYGDVSEQDYVLAGKLLVPHPFNTLVEPVALGENFNSVKKTYISCTEDRAITPPIQELMYSNFPETEIIKISSSHSPFLSAPKMLAEVLLK